MQVTAKNTLYGTTERLKPRVTNGEHVPVPAGSVGRLVRSGTDDHGVAYNLVLFGDVYVYLPPEKYK